MAIPNNREVHLVKEIYPGTAKFLGDRIRQWRKSIPLKSYELASLIKVSQGSLSDIENNKSLPSADTLAKLYQFTELNIIWLLTGKGPIKRENSSPEGNPQKKNATGAQEHDLRELVEKLTRVYNAGNIEHIAHLRGFLLGVDPGS